MTCRTAAEVVLSIFWALILPIFGTRTALRPRRWTSENYPRFGIALLSIKMQTNLQLTDYWRNQPNLAP
jgi:hypothetical protein